MRWIFATLVLTSCVNVVAPDEEPTRRQRRSIPGVDPPAEGQPSPEAPGPEDPVGPQEPAQGPAAPDPEAPIDPAAPDPTEPAEQVDPNDESDIPGDDDGDGVVQVSAAGPAPADSEQSCAEWTDCGPHYENANSGFDCVDNACTCDATGQWAQACADIGGSWSSWECFCFVGMDDVMPAAAPETPEQADDGTVCWWVWRHRYCDPDEWVDTSYYEEYCDPYGCYDEYVEDGYYIDGRCYGRWIKRCTDGNEYWY